MPLPCPANAAILLPRRLLGAAVAAALCLSAPLAAATDAKVVFKHPFDGAAVDVQLKPGEVETPALKRFKADGTNPYRDDPAALADGKVLYNENCQVCHNTDGSGKMGPPLIGNNFIYPQTANDVGMFAIIYAGASGAMQSFSNRGMTQDQMLKIIAYVRSLKK
jgi:cytochrome c-L